MYPLSNLTTVVPTSIHLSYDETYHNYISQGVQFYKVGGFDMPIVQSWFMGAAYP